MTDTQAKNIYFLGIGGIGMSAIARYYLLEGVRVGGYDRTETALTRALASEGADIHYEDDPARIAAPFRNPDDTLVVYTPAIPHDHAETAWFRSHGFRILKRSEILGVLAADKYVMAVAGTHGKTTTTTLTAWLNHVAGGGGSAFLGGISKNFDSNFVHGPGRRLAVEADEFDRSFHWLTPYATVITATDPDHLDIYGTEEAYLESFRKYTSLIRPDGFLIIHKGLAMQPDVQPGVTTYTYSIEEGDFHATNIRIGGGEIQFDYISPLGNICDIRLGVPVYVNIENGIAAMALAQIAGATAEEIKTAMASFGGVDRRFDFKIKNDHLAFLSDYAHHPEEIRKSITSLKALYPDRKITAVFQPHLYTRTRDFYKEFAESLSLLDEVILLDIYPARELPIPGVTSRLIYDNLRSDMKKTLCTKEELLDLLKKKHLEVLVTLGAGDIDNFVPQIYEMLKDR